MKMMHVYRNSDVSTCTHSHVQMVKKVIISIKVKLMKKVQMDGDKSVEY